MLRNPSASCLAVFFLFIFTSSVTAQKKQLDHSVYDSWESLGEKKISSNGLWVAYTVDVQEGDGRFMLQKTDSSFTLEIPRGYAATFTPDDKFLILSIKPFYKDTRDAKIKKKKPEDFPKDSLGIIDLEKGNLEKVASVISYKVPLKYGENFAYQLSKAASDSILKKRKSQDSIVIKKDSSKQHIPLIIEHVPDKKQKRKLSANTENDVDTDADAEGDSDDKQPVEEGSMLVIRNLTEKRDIKIQLVSEYYWSENGKVLLIEASKSKTDKNIKPAVFIWRSIENRFDTILTGGNDFKNFAIDQNGYQVAFLAERDSSYKSLQKFYKLWYWKNGDKEASSLIDNYTVGMNANWTVNEFYKPNFSKSGGKLFLGTNPIKSIKDTSLVDIDLVKLDVWHYNDDYLQPYQLKNLDRENKRSFLASINLANKQFVQLADLQMPEVIISNEGDGMLFAGLSDRGKRIQMQWEGGTRKDIFEVDANTGNRKMIKADLDGMVQVSPSGKYIYWYDLADKNYFSYLNGKLLNISIQVKQKLYDEEYDMPSYATPYGIMNWLNGDSSLFVYDRYDIWKLDPLGIKKPENITAGIGRKTNTTYRVLKTDPEERFIKTGQSIILKTFDEQNKHAGLATLNVGVSQSLKQIQKGAFALNSFIKAKEANAYVYTKENYINSPKIQFSTDLVNEKSLSNINIQQSQYNWGNAELFSWTAYNGKKATGIVYKPENYIPGKKYPLIVYFYETLSDGLHNYLPPAPTPSRLNIPFFVSRGYVVLAPDIHYEKGYPGKGGFDYVVSGARALVKKGIADSTKMGIQGQSWGGYQVAHIITRTNLFAAAWAGAPVVNMTSAYGGIRWESGMNRQFQYEKSQSRIGATLWEKPQLYMENSPLFHLPKVKTPVVIMSNDADGAVPWYQGIEMFTAMRRLNKKVWMLNYNGEAHNLVERKNRKDIQIREQQFFDWLLKGERPAVWISVGVPAIEKGKSWGLDYVK